MSSSRKRADAPLAAAGPLPAPPWRPDDPLAALDDLMEVLEALCPARPGPAIRPLGIDYRL